MTYIKWLKSHLFLGFVIEPYYKLYYYNPNESLPNYKLYFLCDINKPGMSNPGGENLVSALDYREIENDH